MRGSTYLDAAGRKGESTQWSMESLFLPSPQGGLSGACGGVKGEEGSKVRKGQRRGRFKGKEESKARDQAKSWTQAQFRGPSLSAPNSCSDYERYRLCSVSKEVKACLLSLQLTEQRRTRGCGTGTDLGQLTSTAAQENLYRFHWTNPEPTG